MHGPILLSALQITFLLLASMQAAAAPAPPKPDQIPSQQQPEKTKETGEGKRWEYSRDVVILPNPWGPKGNRILTPLPPPLIPLPGSLPCKPSTGSPTQSDVTATGTAPEVIQKQRRNTTGGSPSTVTTIDTLTPQQSSSMVDTASPKLSAHQEQAPSPSLPAPLSPSGRTHTGGSTSSPHRDPVTTSPRIATVASALSGVKRFSSRGSHG